MATSATPEQRAVIAAYAQQTAALRDQLTRYVLALWASLGSYRAAQVRTFTAQLLPVVQGAISQMQALTSGYLASLSGLTGTSSTPAAVTPLTVGSVRSGADPVEVYGRPFHLVWRQLHDLAPLNAERVDQAIQAGADRAVQTALTDTQLAKTYTAQQVLTRSRHVVGYRRVLEGPHSCGLCVIASTQRYHKGELMPIHPSCDCAVAPIIGDSDPGQVINQPLLDKAHAAIRDTFGTSDAGGRALDYRHLLITHVHGELGPVLAVRGRPFAGPSNI